MQDAAEELFDDETIAATEAAVDDAIRRAGDPAAVRALLVALAEREAATSLGYRRGRQPARRPT